MPSLPLVFAPDPIFKKRAEPVTEIDATIQSLAEDMLDTLYENHAVGIGANMVGALKRVIVVDLQEGGERTPLVCINPELLAKSTETQTNDEASLCFPGIRVEVTRPSQIEMRYMTLDGRVETLEAHGWLAAVILHEMEYLDGKTFLDNLSKMKRDRLIKKMIKDQKNASCCGDPSCSNNS